MPFKAELRPAGICGVLEVLSEGQEEGISGGGAPRSGLDISQPPASSFCIVAEQHYCTQKAPLITSARSYRSGATMADRLPPITAHMIAVPSLSVCVFGCLFADS